MQKLSNSQRQFLLESALRYYKDLPGSVAEEYLARRGLLGPINEYRLGVVENPLPGHEQYRGMVSIPYLRNSTDGQVSVVSIRFRCIEDHEHEYHGKYNSMPGDRPRLYNTQALQDRDDEIAICEGEFDAISASLAGVAAVGVPGVQAWQEHFREPFLGYETVWILADGDSPGLTFAKQLAGSLPNGRIIQMPDGYDTNSFIADHGADALTERIN